MGVLDFAGHPAKVKSAQRPAKDKRNPDVVSIYGRFSTGGRKIFRLSWGHTTSTFYGGRSDDLISGEEHKN